MSGDRAIEKLWELHAATGSTFTPEEQAEAAKLAATFPKRPKKVRAKILRADLIPDRLPAPNADQFYAELNKLAHARTKGCPLAPSIKAVGAAIFYGWRTGQRLTIAQIARLAHVCSQTVQSCIAYLEPFGILGVLNVMVRFGADWRRGANLYLPPSMMLPHMGRMSRRYIDRVAAFYAEWAPKLGLHFRTSGYNTTPLKPPGGT